MTNGPPPTASGSSKSTPASRVPPPTSLPSRSAPPNGHPPQTYPNYAAYGNPWLQYPGYAPGIASTTNTSTTQQSYYPNISSNPYAAHMFLPQLYTPPKTPAGNPSTKTSPDPVAQAPPARSKSSTPTPPAPETFKHWDEAIKKFLVRTKLVQTLHGLENDILVLNPEWEQKVIPEALKEMVNGLQTILERIAGKKKVADEETMDVDIDSQPAPGTATTEPEREPERERSLEERKLDYVRLANGSQPRSQSSINRSISQFLAQTRARNDASNRAEFLYTLEEKKRTLQEEMGDQAQAAVAEIASCARVDAKPIDRDKQMKYDIAKNGEGPLTKTVKHTSTTGSATTEHNLLPNSHASSSVATSSAITTQAMDTDARSRRDPNRKRKFVDFEETQLDNSESDLPQNKANSKGKGKGKKEKGKQKQQTCLPYPAIDEEDPVFSSLTAEKHPGIEVRLKNMEEHLALRYVPSTPRTLLARLKYLEDHIIKLEKEYPPWAALHFNQPNRGWPAPPRATPVIVPPQLRSSSSATQTTTTSLHPTTTNIGTPVASISKPTGTTMSSTGSAVKSRKANNSSLHKAVLDRLEVQRAMNEINGREGSGSGA